MFEIAIVGHSNCGKSSLVNALTGRGPWSKAAARVSDRPGWTQNVNFIQMGLPAALIIVDCPGYGHAITHAFNQKRWERTLYRYIELRKNSKILRQVCVLLDVTRGLSKLDIDLMKHLEKQQTKFQLILTKADLLTEIEVILQFLPLNEWSQKVY
jgi:GTP-binding protein